MNTKILVCCHKKDICATQEPYMPIHVGKAMSSVELGFTGDNSGDNISKKNSSYCELTGIYWAWKNLKDVDVIGLCHYRRYFDFHKQCKFGFRHTSFDENCFANIDLTIPEQILSKVSEGAVVVADRDHNKNSIGIDYCLYHYSDDLRKLTNIIQSLKNKELEQTYYNFMFANNRFSPYNMFLMNWNDFDEYCGWLFDILYKLEDQIPLSTYNSYQARIFGFIAERLLNVWLIYKKKTIVTKPVIWINNGEDILNKYNLLTLQLRDAYFDFQMLLSNLENIKYKII
jgi:hypothetical protein